MRTLGRQDTGILAGRFALGRGSDTAAVRRALARRKNEMNLGDACCVRLAELLPDAVVFTVDRKDFSGYRKCNRQPVPCRFPD